jgi:Phage integrase, N-terminal SAM-like domain
LKAAEGKRLLINDGIASRAPVLFGGVLDRFLLEQNQEQEAEQITHSTYVSYRSMISQHIRPKWGDVCLRDVRPALVQDWLRKLTLSPKYKGHIRSLMYRLFDRAMIWELIGVDRNPMQLVEVKGISKRRQRPRILQVKDAWRILDALSQPYRTIVLIALWLRFANQRNSRIALDGLRFQAVGGSDPAIIGRQAAQQLEDRVFAGRSSPRTGFRCRAEEMARAVSRVRGAMALSESGDWPALTRRLDPSRLSHSDESAIGAWKDRVPHVPPQLSGVAGRNRSARGRAAETHAARAHFHHDGQYGNASLEAKRKANRPLVQRLLKRSAGNEPVFIQ